jgi:hypothetical protein
VYLSNDAALSWQQNLGLSIVQLLAVLVLFSFNTSLLAAVLAISLIGVANIVFESQVDPKNGYRLLSLLVVVLVPGFWVASEDTFTLHSLVSVGITHLSDHLPLFDMAGSVTEKEVLLVTFGFLVLANETNILVRAVFHHFHLEPQQAADTKGDEIRSEVVDTKEYNAGRVIGFLERWLMFLVVLHSENLSALAFIIAAKGLARMKQLENKQFAEYMLIGTLLSTLAAVLVGKWIDTLLVAG